MIEEHPTSDTVFEGEYANFTCSINCSEAVSMRWRLAVPRLGVMSLNENYVKVKLLKRRWETRGVIIQNESTFCELSGCEVITIRILATRDLDGAVVQCAAYGRSRDVEPSYSAFALFHVVPQPEPEPDQLGPDQPGPDQPEPGPDQPGPDQPEPNQPGTDSQPPAPTKGETLTEETTSTPPPPTQ